MARLLGHTSIHASSQDIVMNDMIGGIGRRRLWAEASRSRLWVILEFLVEKPLVEAVSTRPLREL